MKRCLIAVIIISVLVSGLLLGCDSESASTKTPTSKDALTPRVIEKNVEIKFRHTEIDWLPFYLKVGDRVEGEVSMNDEGAFKHFVIGEVRDPYGNVVVQTSHLTRYGEYFENSGFPWRFAFIAYTDGEYELGVFFSGQVQGLSPSAHLKITCYEGD